MATASRGYRDVEMRNPWRRAQLTVPIRATRLTDPGNSPYQSGQLAVPIRATRGHGNHDSRRSGGLQVGRWMVTARPPPGTASAADGPTVRRDHGTDDGEPQPRAVHGRAFHAAAAERLEQLLHPLRRDLRPAGRHPQLGRAGASGTGARRPPSRRRRCAARRSPPGCRPPARAAPGRPGPGPARRAPRPAAPARRPRRATAASAGRTTSARSTGADHGQLGCPRCGPAAAGPAMRSSARRVASRTTVAHPAQLLDVGVGIGEGHVDLGAQHRQRGAQLVAGVGDEPALGVERGLQPVEHRVEPGGQLGDLAAGSRTPVRVSSDSTVEPPRGRRDRVQRPEHPPDQPPGHERRGDHRPAGTRPDPPPARRARAASPTASASCSAGTYPVADPHRAARRQRGHGRATPPTSSQPSHSSSPLTSATRPGAQQRQPRPQPGSAREHRRGA